MNNEQAIEAIKELTEKEYSVPHHMLVIEYEKALKEINKICIEKEKKHD